MGVWGSVGPQLVFFSYDGPVFKSPLSKPLGQPPVRDDSGIFKIPGGRVWALDSPRHPCISVV